MSLIAWLIVGGIAGYLASLILNRQGMGILTDIVVGIVGAFVGGAVISIFNGGGATFSDSITGFNLSSIVIATVGAVVFLGILKLFTAGRSVKSV